MQCIEFLWLCYFINKYFISYKAYLRSVRLKKQKMDEIPKDNAVDKDTFYTKLKEFYSNKLFSNL